METESLIYLPSIQCCIPDCGTKSNNINDYHLLNCRHLVCLKCEVKLIATLREKKKKGYCRC